MFLRSKCRFKDGKEHRYFSVVENRRVSGGRVVQKHVLYLGEINDSQRAAWCDAISVFDESGKERQLALFPSDRTPPPLSCETVQVRVITLPRSGRLGGWEPPRALAPAKMRSTQRRFRDPSARFVAAYSRWPRVRLLRSATVSLLTCYALGANDRNDKGSDRGPEHNLL